MILMLSWTHASLAEDPVILWQWTDGAGKLHYTDNFNSIPQAYRPTAHQGKFIFDSNGAKTNNGKNSDAGKQFTNKLERYVEKYYEKEGILIVEGKLRNGYSRPVGNIKIKVVFYDDKKNFVRAETTFVEPILLQAGEEGQYKIEIPYTPQISAYTIEIIKD